MHVKAASSLRHVAAVRFIDVLDMLPAHTIRGHRMIWWRGLAALRREQSRDDIISVRRFDQIVDGTELHCADGGRDVP